MRTPTRILAPLVVGLFLATSGAVAQSAAPQPAQPPAGAEPLSAWELLVLYGDKTWMWPTGGAYLARDRTFEGWVEEGGVRTYGSGRWLVTDSGQMCFQATWGEADDVEQSCFRHVALNGDVYQLPTDGDWYVFKHDVAEETDEYQKLVDGNQVPGQDL